MDDPDGEHTMTRSTPTMGSTHTERTALATQTAQHGRAALGRSVRWLSFWTAITLPVLYLPLLYAGIGAQTGALFLGLLVLQLIALLAGHGYNQPTQS
jgi:hypothetical protein